MDHNTDKHSNVIFVCMLALVHGGFWLLVGLGIGHILWGGA